MYTQIGLAGTALSKDSVKALQNSINSVLGPQGYAALTPDGKIGPLTCGALMETRKYDNGAIFSAFEKDGSSFAALCPKLTVPKRSSTSPVPSPVPGPVPSPIGPPITTTETTPPTPEPSPGLFAGGLDTTKVIAGGAIIAALVVVVYAMKKKGRSAAAA